MSPRKSIGDVVGDAPAEAPEIPARQPPAAEEGTSGGGGRSPSGPAPRVSR